jgi:N-acetylglucosaminylphosphatidylinositol deacetylase
LLYVFLFGVTLSFMLRSSLVPSSHSRTLFVIAHPDDEAMFFAPTILFMHDRSQLHLICLSSGNNDGLGKVREKELYKSCAVLGIPEERVRVYDEDGLQDGMRNHWDSTLVMDIVRNTVDEFQINTVCAINSLSYSFTPLIQPIPFSNLIHFISVIVF